MSKRKLLLADDSETVQKVVNLTFELEGIEVITFGDGDSAMEQLSAVAPDVVLADVNMPGMSGYDICQSIKGNEATKNTPVILLVGSFEPFDEEKAMQVGADDYLTKPFQSIRQLVGKVNELLAVEKSAETNTYSFDETLKMDEKPVLESDFGDPGMDDEMIQTDQVGSLVADETPKYISQTDVQTPEEEDASKTQPLSENDWQDIYSTDQGAENSPPTVYELEDEPSPQPQVFEHSDEIGSEEASVETTGEQISETNEENGFGVQPDDIDYFYQEPDYQEAEPENVQEISGETEEPQEIEKPQYEVQEQLPESEPMAEYAEPADFQTEVNLTADYQSSVPETNEIETDSPVDVEIETESAVDMEIETEQSQMSSPVPVINFDEFDLLEIPYPETLKTASSETATELEVPDPALKTGEELPEENETVQVRNEVTEQLTGVNLSPEDIEAIADKVVEKLSARLKE